MTASAAVVERLVHAPLELLGRFADASNATLLVRLTDRDPRSVTELAAALHREPTLDDLPAEDLAVYKPRRGEAPLWDFPVGTLHRREVAAWVVSDVLGWGVVPETVLREDAPAGVGSLQRFVPHDPDIHYFTLRDTDDEALRVQLVTMAVFDLVIDNADRKGGHVLLESRRAGLPRVRGVDHGVSFNVAPKLRTVIWDFADTPVPCGMRADLRRLADGFDDTLDARLRSLLTRDEVDVVRDRVERLTELEVLPPPRGRHPYPWPLL
jgi:uncharacterized repeat protein (TIGR03843 family)